MKRKDILGALVRYGNDDEIDLSMLEAEIKRNEECVQDVEKDLIPKFEKLADELPLEFNKILAVFSQNLNALHSYPNFLEKFAKVCEDTRSLFHDYREKVYKENWTLIEGSVFNIPGLSSEIYDFIVLGELFEECEEIEEALDAMRDCAYTVVDSINTITKGLSKAGEGKSGS